MALTMFRSIFCKYIFERNVNHRTTRGKTKIDAKTSLNLDVKLNNF